jgi:hypothetical protein
MVTCSLLIGSSIAKNAICKTAKDRRGLVGGVSSDDQVSESLNGGVNEIADVRLPELMLSFYMVYSLPCCQSKALGYLGSFH